MSEVDETQELDEEEEEAEGWKEYRFICGGVSKPAEEAIESVGGHVERLWVAHGIFLPLLYVIILLYDDDDDDQGFSFFTDDGKKARQFYVCSADAHHDLYILCADGSIPRFESDRSVLRVITEGEWFAMEDGPDTDEKKS